MKTIAFGVSGLAIVVMVIVGLLQVVNVDTRAENLQGNLHSALEASLNTALNSRAYTIDDEDQLVADVVQGVVLELNDPKATLEVKVNKVDRILGIISMKVTAKFPSVSGGTSTVSVDRTVILEHVNNAPTAGSYTLAFQDPTGATFKSYTLTANSQQLPYPAYTDGSGKAFLGWQLAGVLYADTTAGRAALGSLPLNKDYTFVAKTGS